MSGLKHPVTPDGRYFVVKGRLWRMADPSLTPEKKQQLVKELMAARRAVKKALANKDIDAEFKARGDVDRTKIELGERGPVWWADDAPDLNRKMVKHTRYADWFKDQGTRNREEGSKGTMEESNPRKRAGKMSRKHSPSVTKPKAKRSAKRLADDVSSTT